MASPFPHNATSAASAKVSSPDLLMRWDASGAVLPDDKDTPESPAILITSALPYVNNVPHLGNIIGSTLSADVYARYSRSRNRKTLYICGTDEYGTATETKALEDKVTPQQLCDKYNAVHRTVYEWFQLGFDHFGRTTTPQQTEIAQAIFLGIHKNGFLEERGMMQLFCEKDQRFLADRYVEGVCPKCSYEDARGDQCDHCGTLLDAIDLISPRCKLCGTQPVSQESRHMFLRIDELQPRTAEWARAAAAKGGWSSNGIQITESWFREGLRPFALSRDLKWGVPVPLDGFRDKVFYVWFDAPIGYPSITANYTKDWEKWWKNPDNVRLYQFMGKDNVRFHTVIFPSCLLGTGDNWTMLHHISTTEYLQYEGGKFSKSRNVGVFGDRASAIGVAPSVWRYYLLANRPETSDSQFNWGDFVLRNNSELLANFGNFVNRVLTFAAKKYDGVLPAIPDGSGLSKGPTPLPFSPKAPGQRAEKKDDDDGKEDVTAAVKNAGAHDRTFPQIISDFVSDVNSLLATYVSHMEAVKIRPGLATFMALSSRGNVFLVEAGLDNALFDSKRQQCDATVLLAVNLIWVLATLAHPFMPETADQINTQLAAPIRAVPEPSAESAKSDIPARFAIDLLPGHKLGKPAHLFKPIDPKKEEEWRRQFSGSGSAVEDQGPKVSKKAAMKAAKAARAAKEAELALPDDAKTPELKELEEKASKQAEVVKELKQTVKDGNKEAAAQLDVEVKKLQEIKPQIEALIKSIQSSLKIAPPSQPAV